MRKKHNETVSYSDLLKIFEKCGKLKIIIGMKKSPKIEKSPEKSSTSKKVENQS